MEKSIIKNIKEKIIDAYSKHILKIGGFKIFFKLCKTGFSKQYI